MNMDFLKLKTSITIVFSFNFFQNKECFFLLGVMVVVEGGGIEQNEKIRELKHRQ